MWKIGKISPSRLLTNFSSLSSASLESTISISFTSPYLDVCICCQEDVVVSSWESTMLIGCYILCYCSNFGRSSFEMSSEIQSLALFVVRMSGRWFLLSSGSVWEHWLFNFWNGNIEDNDLITLRSNLSPFIHFISFYLYVLFVMVWICNLPF